MKKLIQKLASLLITLVCLTARAQTNVVPLVHANQLALEWSYPAAGVTPDLGFALYDATNIANLTNGPVLAVVMVTNQVSWNGQTYPQTNGANETFVWPITAANQQQFFAIASSNLTGLGQPAPAPYPVLTPLENLTSFLMVEHP